MKFTQWSFYKKHRELLVVVMDMCALGASFILALFFKSDLTLLQYDIPFNKIILILLVTIVVYLICYICYGVPKSLWSYTGNDEIIRITISNLTATAVLLLFNAFIYHVVHMGAVYCLTFIIDTSTMLALRMGYRMLRTQLNTQKVEGNPINTLVIGAGDGGYVLLKELEKNKKSRINIVGFVDDNRVGKVISGHPVLGDTYHIPDLVKKHNISLVYIAIPSLSKADLNRIVDICECTDVDIKIMQDESHGFRNAGSSYPIADISINDLLGRDEAKLDTNQISGYLTNKIVLVTGAGGSIGSELCRQIIKYKPQQLLMLDIYENDLYMLEKEIQNNQMLGTIPKETKIVSLVASIRDEKEIDRLWGIYKPEVVFHAAAHKHVPLMETQPKEAIKNNIFGTYNVIEMSIKQNVERFIEISTDKAVNPTNVMGASKRMTEMILQAYGPNEKMKMSAVRFGNVLGSHGSVIPIFKKQIEQGGPVTITSKEIVRYFMTIPEAAQLVLQAGAFANNGNIYVLNMGEPVKIYDLAVKMIRLAGYRPNEDIQIIETGLRPGEKMFEQLSYDTEHQRLTEHNQIYVMDPESITEKEVKDKLDRFKKLLGEDCSAATVKKEMFEIIGLKLPTDHQNKEA